jgi:ribose 5-phosphate isomerase B|tara:strand:- start:1160 stop:1591 length:432 start_codon:yes stop_codon:yes gene_type:complete
MKIAIGADHAAYNEKKQIINYLNSKGFEIIDLGTNSSNSVDYPIFGQKVAKSIANNVADRGIVICGTGIGISIAANRYKGIRATLCTSEIHAEMARKHNDSNILALGARTTDFDKIKSIIDVWLETNFEGGRHQDRIDLIDVI